MSATDIKKYTTKTPAGSGDPIYVDSGSDTVTYSPPLQYLYCPTAATITFEAPDGTTISDIPVAAGGYFWFRISKVTENTVGTNIIGGR